MRQQRMSGVVLGCVAIILWTGVAWSKPAPTFALPDWRGQLVQSTQLVGQGPVVVNFWATWCVPCMAEMKHLVKLQKELGPQGLRVVSISIDDSKTASKIPSVVRQRGLTELTVLLDGNKSVHDKFMVSNVPELFLVDARGEIVSHHKGFKSGDEKKLTAEIQELLANRGPK